MIKPNSMKRDRNRLSERQRKILDFIEAFLEEHGYPPTIRDIGKAVQIPSTSVVNYNLNKLVREGYLERSKKVSRGLQLVKDEEPQPKKDEAPHLRIVRAAVLPVPMVGQIVASRPVEFFDYHQDEDEVVEVPASLVGKIPLDQVYALRVKGQSMIDAMVNDGDVVILRRQETAQDKDMVAAWLGDTNETTLKYFFHEGHRIRLQPANPLMDPIYCDPSHLRIQGRVLAVLRML
jgi:repressor LexA